MLPRVKPFLKLALIGMVLTVFITGCFDSTQDFKIRFNDVHGLRKGDPVYFEESVIGDVEAIEYTDAGVFLVSVSIQKEFASTATDKSKFYVDAEPQRREQKLIRVVQLEKGGTKIEEDAIVRGHTKYAVLYEQFAYQLGKNITIFESGINEFLSALQGISTDEQMKKIERQLDDIIADLGNMSREMKHKLENEVLPLLREKIEELQKSLEGTGQEEEIEHLHRKMETIMDTLRV